MSYFFSAYLSGKLVSTSKFEKILNGNATEAVIKKARMENVANLEERYHDDFNWQSIGSSDWKTGFLYPAKEFQSNHSFVEQKQSYNDARNVQVSDSVLNILTKKERTEGTAWDSKRGMVKCKFDYSSAVINNADRLEVCQGDVVRIKVRCRGRINHGVYLRGKNGMPMLTLFGYKKGAFYCGLRTDNREEKKVLDGLWKLPYMIFSVALEEHDIVWYVNNLEVYRIQNMLGSDVKLYMHMLSFIGSADKGREGKLQVDWVKVYKPRQKEL